MKRQEIGLESDNIDGNKHYSEKGGHGARSEFYRLVRQVQRIPVHGLPDDVRWLVRRQMLRVPRDGRT